MKATIAALVSMVISLSVAFVVVPILGGHPDGPGFWMSAVLPLVIAWPASAYQFALNERLKTALDQVAAMNVELARLHRELTDVHAALREKSRIDGLTGALNRESFMERFEQASGRTGPSALLIADADHFKRINDTFGHQCGDDALRGIAEAIRMTLRPSDFFGRIGGEEFAVFLDDAGEQTASAIAEMIRLAALGIGLHSNGQPVTISLSIGVVCTFGAFEPRRIIAIADARLYAAKRGGRNRMVLDGDARDVAVAG